MATLKIVVVVGLLASAVAVALACAWGAVTGASVSPDEVHRLALLSFVSTGGVIGVLRSRATRRV